MKRVIACMLMLALCLTVFAACDNAEPANPLADAKAYVYNTYKNSNEVNVVDYTLIGRVLVGDAAFTVEWSADVAEDTVKFIPGDNGMVTVDINEMTPEEVKYTLTATLRDEAGNTETVQFSRRIPAAIIIEEGMSYEEIVEAAYKLEAGIAMETEQRLYGKIVKIDTAYSDQYKNITVTIQIGDLADKPIMCYRLAGEGAATLAVGDEITVEGKIKNYNGTIEFDAGCKLLSVGYDAKDQSAILEAAYKLEAGIAMQEPCTLYGVISTINTAYSDQYKNITVTIICSGDDTKPMMCYRLAGEGAADLAVGDTIVVTGTIKNYNGTIEFDAGCTLDKVIKGTAPAPEAPADPAEIVAAAYALKDGETLPYTATLSGKITEIGSAWSDQYKNITVTIQVGDLADKPITCFRLKGDGADKLAVGDSITVTGILKNYKDSIQFDAGCTLVK